MTDSEGESSSSDSSSHHELMSVSDPEGDSREDEMPSADGIASNKVTQPEAEMDSTSSNSLSSDEQAVAESSIPSHDVNAAIVSCSADQNQAAAGSSSLMTRLPTVDLDDAAAVISVEIFSFLKELLNNL
jgi:hypothetical protein